MGQRESLRRRTGKPAPERAPRRPLWALVLLAAFAMAGTAEERTFGTLSDEQQMLGTAVSLATSGEIGIAKGDRFRIARPRGDAVMPYGMGQSLVEVPAVWLARPWERAFGAGSSQTLFVLLQFLLVAASAAAAGLLARALGASAAGEGVAVVGASLGSPLWAAAATGFSEPLQAACITLAILFALRAAAPGEVRRRTALAAAAGLVAGFAVVAKGVNLVLVPLLLAPLVLPGAADRRARVRSLLAAAAGAAASLALWLAFEVVRFGRPLSSYGDQRFSHPPLDGLWRLLVGPNKGVLVYFPLAALAAWGVARLARRRETRGAAAAIGGVFLALLAISSAWWAWDGNAGWGPRFLLPALPPLAAAAGSLVAEGDARGTRLAAYALVLAGVLVNALGVLQVDAATFHYLASAGPVKVTPEEARLWPASLSASGTPDRLLVARPLVAPLDPAYAPLRVHAFLLKSRLAADGPADLEERLKSPPWLAVHPDAVPRLASGGAAVTGTTPLARYLLSPFAWPHLFSWATRPGEGPGTYNTALLNALSDQVFRNLDLGRPERALALARYVHETRPSDYSAALVAESLRLAGRRDELRAFRESLPERALAAPALSIVLALNARDLGQEEIARAHLEAAARRFRSQALDRARGAPMAAWPRTFRELIAEPGA